MSTTTPREVRRSYDDAVEHALDLAMARDPRVVLLGEDVRLLRRHLLVRHGPERVLDTPISEGAFVGAAVGAALAGLRPVVELFMVDFVAVAFDALLNHAAKIPALSGGAWPVPMVLRAPTGAGYGDGGQHGQALWGLLGGIPGLQVVVPSTPADGAGAMLAAVASEHPVVVMEPKLLTDTLLEWLAGSRRGTIELDVPASGHHGAVPEPPEPLRVGTAAWRRRGGDVSLVSLGVGVHRCLRAADVLAERGVEAGVLDLRWVAPLDTAALLDAAAAGAVVVVDEDVTRGGLSGEVAARLLEHDVHVPFARVTTEGVLPYARERERRALPNVERIVAATTDLVAR